MSNIILDNQTIEYEIIYKKIKNLYLRVKNNKIIITSPKTYSKNDIEFFIIKHKNFVIKHLIKDKLDIYNLDTFSLWGKNFEIEEYSGKTIRIEEEKCFVPKNISNKTIEKFYQEQTILNAKRLVDNELKILMKDFNLEKIQLKSQLMSSRLGSCKTSEAVIKLNSVMARFDIKYLRAVLIHEIVHLKIKNHQKEFYEILLKFEPNYKKIRSDFNKILKLYQL